jgi:hypothetical protein
VTNLAQDTDLPPQALVFHVLSAPAGVGLDPATGRLEWRPAIAQSPSTNLLTLVVTDNGVSSLSATQSFRVNVRQPVRPTLAIPAPLATPFTLTVSGDDGPDYVILTSTDLLFWQTGFTTNSPPLPFTWTDPTAPANPQRFYRVLLQP